MAKKKKIKLDFTPSKYQEKIFDFIQHGVGNGVISAKAGAGKTVTIVNGMKFIPLKQKCIFLAFNKSIAEELGERLKDLSNVTVRTSHSLGFLMLRRNLGSDIEVDEYKYSTYVKKHINDLTSIENIQLTRQQVQEYIESIISLIDFSRFNLAQSVKEINEVAMRYDIPIAFDECEVTQKCLEWGKNNYETIDYTDMLWIPVELSLKPIGLQYDWVFVDECQDQSILMFELIKKCFKRGTRFICVGDEKQCINLFAGSNEESFQNICNQPNTQIFDLPISYRCSKNVINLANTLVPDIIARDDAPDGKIIENCRTGILKDGDMVLARSKSPLMKLYIKLLKKNVNCYIKGKDIGLNLIKMLDSIDKEDLNVNLDKDGVFVKLYEQLFNDRNKLMNKRGIDYKDATLATSIMEKYDAINTLIVLSEKLTTKKQLISKIQDVFKEDAKGVCLSTIHKAKGLEADNVYILCRSCMPSKLVHHEWEKIQEQNLIYVAYTRAKNTLGFISEKEIPPSGSMQEPIEIINELNYIENVVCKIIGKEPIEKMESADLSRFELKSMTKIEKPDIKEKVIKNKPITQTNETLLNELEMLLKK